MKHGLTIRALLGLRICDISFLIVLQGSFRISDNESISQKILVESELFFTQSVDIGVAYLCLEYGVFITTRFDAMRICIQH